MPIDTPTISMKSVYDLQGYHFLIPSYQRGYRWTKNQVVNLLEDIEKFHHDSAKAQTFTREGNKQAYKFYCLQPLVVKRHDEDNRTVWEVIDGQQRLTTILLIMRVLTQQLQATEVQPFHIDYATRREEIRNYLLTLNKSKSENSVDLFYMQAAVETIRTWFEERRQLKLHWMQTLTNDSATGHNTRFIWYEIPETEDPIEVFTRLNVGKIQLTNSELVRALFLSKSRTNHNEPTAISLQLHIAENWDSFEQQLQKNAFWYFFHNGTNTPTNRLEYLFEQITTDYISQMVAQPDWISEQHHIFQMYSDRFGHNPDFHVTAKELWDEVRTLYFTLDEWFEDRSLYHLIGFLLHTGTSIQQLRLAARLRDKKDFRKYLLNEISTSIFDAAVTSADLRNQITAFVNDYSYHSKRKILRDILLLFNIATLLENEKSNIKFPFDSFKLQQWDIEHIKAVADDMPDRVEHQRNWVRQVLMLCSKNRAFRVKLVEARLLQQYIDETTVDFDESDMTRIFTEITASTTINFSDFFQDFFNGVIGLFEETASESADTLQNLTLLDQNTNRSYQNNPYPVKRERILELDRGGTYVPLCTRNVFLKAYSGSLDEMLVWSDKDQEDYETTIIETLVRFFEKEGNHD